MSSEILFAVTGVILFAIGAAGTILLANLLRRVLAFNIMGSGACVVLVSLAQRNAIADPVPQAMVLTGIVVAVAATGVALALTRRLHQLTGACEITVDAEHD